MAPSDEVLDYLHSNSDVTLDLLGRVYIGIDGLLGRMAALMSGSAKKRLIYELVIEASRLGVKQTDGSCLVTLREKDLGARAGLSRETVSREMHKLKIGKLISIKGKGIIITNLKLLKRELEQSI
jgi:CRP-like cAMP-binding protein